MVCVTRVLLLLVLSGAAVAHAAHVTDRLLVGLYPQPAADGAPLQLLPSGAPLEVLDRSAGFVEVRLADGTQGWIEAGYISEDKPARAILLETQARLREATDQLNRLKADAGDAGALRELNGNTAPSAREAKLRHALQSAEARIAELERRVADRPRVEDLQAELEQLQERVVEAASILGVAHPEDAAPPASAAELIGRYQLWIGAAVALLVGFVAGIALFDYRIRKRYGGFRI